MKVEILGHYGSDEVIALSAWTSKLLGNVTKQFYRNINIDKLLD